MGKSAIIYWSGTGNTEAMANAIFQGMQSGGADAELFEVTSAPADLSGYDSLAFGCPSMGAEVLEEDSFEPYFISVESQLSGKKVALFGSYGWGDGEWMRDWVDRTAGGGAEIFEGEGFIVQEAPDEDACVEFGKKFASA